MEDSDMFCALEEPDLEFSDHTDSEIDLLNCDQTTDTFDQTSDISLTDSENDSHFANIAFIDDLSVASEDVIEGRHLYLIFLQYQLLKCGLKEPDYLRKMSRKLDRNLCTNILNLEKLISRFEICPKRKWIQVEAYKVQLQGNFDFYNYANKLRSLFQETRVSWEKILVIFTFCADISIRLLDCQNEKLFGKIQDANILFLDSEISAWVNDEGGWEVILDQSVTPATKIAIISFCCVGLLVLCVYIRNNSK